MMRDVGDRVEVSGAMTVPGAAGLLVEGAGLLSRQETVFDLSGVTEVDSSGLAVIFGWQRAAKSAGKTVRIANPPQNLGSLADVYGVRELLPL